MKLSVTLIAAAMLAVAGSTAWAAPYSADGYRDNRKSQSSDKSYPSPPCGSRKCQKQQQHKQPCASGGGCPKQQQQSCPNGGQACPYSNANQRGGSY